ncbi:MAG: filamentous hemagglutinin N-terminal domain-containing protein, partial [Sulfuricurvum sp.]
MFTQLYRQSISCILSSILLGNMLYADGIVVDTAAAQKYQATMDTTANHIPLINIVKPNSTGLSHNKFKEFNVESQGIILNNATSAVSTQLGGWVQGNANLGATPARVILNEVTGTNRSLLYGYTEVAGHSADVIVANPNGITVNGGGFINTSRATLTTGTAVLNGETLEGFHVQRGDILIDGEGMNVDNIDRVELYTKALMLNAALYAKKLDVVTGENTITRDGTVTSDNITGSEEFSIDSSLLGGIYGSTIRLIATDKGVGVNLPPITYASNALSLSADGKIILSKIVADQMVAVDSSGSDITVTEDIAANDISLHAGKKISIATDRVVKAFNDITVNAGESIINDGEINALLGTGTTAVTTLDLSNNGLIGGYDVTINSDAIENIGALYAKNDLSVVGETLNNSGVIRSNRDMDLLIEDTLSNQKKGTIYSDGSLSIAANGVKDKINTIDNYGVIQSGNNINISAKTLNNLADAPVINPVTASTTTVIPQGGANDFDIITVTTTTDVIDVPNDPALILSAGDMSIDAENINNFYSLIASDADMILNADSVKNVGNVLVTTVVTVTTKYRDEKYCSRKFMGGCVSHKHRPGYRGTFTTTENERIPLSNAGIIAKNSISGNVVTLNNLSDQLNGALDAQQILDNLATITVLETSSSQLQELTVLLQNANTELIESIGTTSNIDAIITDAVDKNDLSVFNENMTLLQTDLHQAITDSADSISTFETLIATIKTQNTAEGTHYDTAALESTLEQLKNNISAVEQHLSDIETLQASLQTLNDLQTQKDSFLASDQAIRTLMTENTEVLDTLDIAPLTSGFEVASDALRTEVNTALALQENVEYKIITQDEGLYQTNLHRNLTANPAIAYSESTEAIIDGITLPQGKYGLFLVNQDINHPYLIEQNPLYTDYNTFISSDYILERLGFEPDNTLKRLGDGAYETQLVRDSVIRLSGERYLGNYTSDAEQYQALMDNALRVQAELGLVIGVSLTQDQIAGLADNIVWLEEKTIEGIKVLVPRVYLASGALNESGPKIAANTIDLNVANSLTNDGVIQASDTLSLNAKTIKNINGVLSSGGDMAVQTQGDLTNTSGTISSGGDMSLRAGGAITSDVTSQQVQYNYARGVQTATQKGKTSQISAGGTLSAQADQSITLNNADVKAKEDVTLISQNGDVNVDAFKTDDAYDFRLKNGYTKGNSTTYEGSSITGKNVSLGGDKITLTASAIDAQENLVLAGKEEVALIAQNDHTYTDTKIKSSNGLFGSKVQQDTVYKESTVGSTLNAQNITIASGKDVTLQAADLKAADTIEVDAAGDINVLAKEYREGEMHYTKKSGFLGLSGSVSLDQTDALKLHEATLKTEAKNIIMNSGKDINIIASEITSAADVQLKAFENLNIVAGEESKSEKHVYEKTSFNPLGVLNLVGIDAGPIYTQDIHNKDNYDTTAKASSVTAGGNIVADTGTTNIVGSNLSAGEDVAITADIGGINIESAQELHNASTLDREIEVKLANIFTSSADAFINAHKMDDTKLSYNIASATYDESTTT